MLERSAHDVAKYFVFSLLHSTVTQYITGYTNTDDINKKIRKKIWANVKILSCFVQLKSILFNILCVFEQNTNNMNIFFFFLIH